MATEPPPKRMRLTEDDLPESDSDNDQDGDELVFEPEEVSEKRDPDYRLSRKRIKASNRFQRAMSGILAKYAKDFTHVGDEIDLETGEVVVNNGHLQNMRFDGDVGVDEEADDGILLEDWMHSDEEEGMPLEDLGNESDEEDSSSGEAERIVHEIGVPPAMDLIRPNPLVTLVGASEPPLLPLQSETPWPDAHAEDWSNLPQQKPRKLSGRSISAWAGHDEANSIWTPDPDYKDDWAPLPRSRVGKFGSLRKTMASSRLSLPAPVSTHTGLGSDKLSDSEKENAEPVSLTNDEDDLTEPSSRSNTGSSPAPSKVMIMRTMRGLPENPPEKSNPSPKPSPKDLPKSNTPKPKPRKDAATERSSPLCTPCNQLVAVREHIVPSFPPLNPNCRRSGRARVQTDFMGLKTWAEALGTNNRNKENSSSIVVELQSPSFRREDYKTVDECVDDPGLPTPPGSDAGQATDDAEFTVGRSLIPDSQETRESRKSSPPAVNKPQSLVEDYCIQYTAGQPSYEFSDDEAPVQFTKRRQASKRSDKPLSKQATFLDMLVDEQRRDHTSPLRRNEKTHLMKGIPDSHPEPVALDPLAQQEPEPLASSTAIDTPGRCPLPKRPGRPRKKLPQQIAIDTSVQETQSRRPGRPRKSFTQSGTESTTDTLASREVQDSQEDTLESGEHSVAVTESNTLLKKRGRGRPRLQRHINATPETVLNVTLHEPSLQDMPAPGSEEDTGNPYVVALGQQTLEVEALDKMEMDTTPPSPSSSPEPTQPLSSNHTIADSTTSLPSSAPQPKHPGTPSRKHKTSPSKPTPSKTSASKPILGNSPSKPSTPHHTDFRTNKTPSSRQSIFSYLSEHKPSDDHLLGNNDLPRLFDSPSAKRKRGSAKKTTYKATPLTTEVYRTPTKRKRRRGEEKEEVIETPGGTRRVCEVDGYHCYGDFCYKCLRAERVI